MKTDILIVGSGVAGLYCALNLPKEKSIIVVTKNQVNINFVVKSLKTEKALKIKGLFLFFVCMSRVWVDDQLVI